MERNAADHVLRIQQCQYFILTPQNRERLNDDEICPICFNDFTDGALCVETGCHHSFHYVCLYASLVHRSLDLPGITCPICNNQVSQATVDAEAWQIHLNELSNRFRNEAGVLFLDPQQ